MEKTFKFENKQQKLYGILHEPDSEQKSVGLIFLHGWGTYRIGPHRFFVDAARELGKLGFTSLRFDFRGRGESEGNPDETTLVDMIDDTQAAIAEILKQQGIEKVVLIGLCSGGEVAVGAVSENNKVDGAVMLSTPLLGREWDFKDEFRKTSSFAKSYWQKLFLAQTWKKVFSFQVNYKAVWKILLGGKKPNPKKNQDEIPREAELIEQFRDFSGKSLFIYAEHDPIAEPSEKAYKRICKSHSDADFFTIAGANHNFYSVAQKKEIITKIKKWLEKI